MVNTAQDNRKLTKVKVDQAWFRSVTKVEMTDISACGRIVFHIPWCPDCVSLIRSRFRDFVYTFVFDLPMSHGKKSSRRRPTRNFRLKGFQTRIGFSAMTTHV